MKSVASTKNWSEPMKALPPSTRRSIRAVGAGDPVAPQRPQRRSRRSPELHRRPRTAISLKRSRRRRRLRCSAIQAARAGRDAPRRNLRPPPPRDKERQLASRKCRRESTPQTAALIAKYLRPQDLWRHHLEHIAIAGRFRRFREPR